LDISIKDIILLIVGAIISAIVFIILAPFVEKPINNFLVRILNKTRISYLFRPKTSIEGLWKQKWNVGQSTHFHNSNEADTILKQINKTIYGEYISGERIYRLQGKIERDQYLTGTWEDISEGNVYFGAFQLYIHIHATHMTGKWIGFSSDSNTIKSGDW
jgi:hypothetical protein